jgi:hypothetical protein
MLEKNECMALPMSEKQDGEKEHCWTSLKSVKEKNIQIDIPRPAL